MRIDFGDPPFARLARVWREASEVLALIARQYGARYLHLLQPNQYAAPGKPLSEEERRVAWRPDEGWPTRAKQGYPFLKAEAGALRAAGIAFYDLTDLFAEETATIYTDDCCHLNVRGNRLLAERLADILIRDVLVETALEE